MNDHDEAHEEQGTTTIARAYPLPFPTEDKRFTIGFLLDVGRVLAEHGYPKITEPRDLAELFLYEPPDVT